MQLLVFFKDDATTSQILSEPTTPLIDEIDVGNWAIGDIEELKDFQTNPPSFDAKQAHILEKK